MADRAALLFSDQARSGRLLSQVALGACVLAALGLLLGVGESVQLRVQDVWYAVRGERSPRPSPQVAIVAIDGASLNVVDERWPWPRDEYVPLLENLRRAGAKVVGFDITFSSPTEQDDAFAHAMRDSGNVVFGMVFNNAGDPSPPSQSAPHTVESQAVPASAGASQPLVPAPGVEPPAPELAAAAAALGHVVLLPASDGTMRRVPTLIRHGDRVYPSLALQVARMYADASPEEIEVTDGRVRVRYADIPISPSGQAWINWPGRDLSAAYPTYSAAAVLRGEVGERELGGKAVLIGMTAEGLDDREFPFGQTLPGVIVHAAFLDNFFTLSFLRTPGWGIGLQWGLFLTLAAAGIAGFPRLPTPVLFGAAPVLLVGVLGLSLYLFVIERVWWPPLYPALGVALPFATTVVFKLRTAEREKKIEQARVREAETEVAEAVLEKGLAFQEKGSLDLASATFAKLPMSEAMKSVYLNLGIDFENRGRPDKAFHCYKRVFDLDPDFEDVKQRLEGLRSGGVGTRFASRTVAPLAMPDAAPGPSAFVPPSPLDDQAATVVSSPASPMDDDARTAMTQAARQPAWEGLSDRTMAAAPAAGLEPQPGSPGSRYRLGGTLGKGAMGEVLLMHDTKLGRDVAVKMMRADVDLPPKVAIEMRHRFVREARTAGRLTHPNVVTIYDSFESDDGVAYIVMEFVEGGTLKSFMKGGGLSVPQIKHVIASAAKGLQFAHEHGIFHRDVKPDNIMISPKTGVVKVMDFGIAHVAESSMTMTGSVMGTPAYMAPEMVSGLKIDARADVYSLGVVLFELLTGMRPFRGSNPSEILLAVVRDDPPAPSTADPSRGVSSAWDPVVVKALAKDPAARYQSIRDLADAVNRVGS